MLQKIATLIFLPGVLLLTHCQSLNRPFSRNTTAPPPSAYETAQAPILQAPEPESSRSSSPRSSPQSSTSQRPRRPERSRVVEHEVVPGDSLWSLSRRYETTIDEIREANGISGNIIRTGTTLKIPTNMPAEQPSSATTSMVNPSSSSRSSSSAPSSSSPPPAPPREWSTTPPTSRTPSSSTPSASAPRYRIPEPVIMPPPGS